jgi:hypothetical protein
MYALSVPTIESMPDEARLWAYHTASALSASEVETLKRNLDQFVLEWSAHGKALAAAYDLKYSQFLLLAVDERKAPASGCSIDSMVRYLGSLQFSVGIQFVGTPPVCYRKGDSVYCCSRDQFRRLVKEGEVSQDTIVFNETIQTVGEYKRGLWEGPFSRSWHSKAFPLRKKGG